MNKQQAGTFALGAAAATLSLLLAKTVFGSKRTAVPVAPVAATTTTVTASKIVPESELNDPAKLRQGFLDVFDELVEFLKQDMKENYEVIDRHIQYIDQLVRYNCLGGKYNRGLYVQQTLINMKKGLGQPVTEDELKKARVLGWAIEWLQAFFLVADDIMDNGDQRRGQPCWFRLDHVKITACNDYIILESHMYRLLKKYFFNKGGNNDVYIKLVDLFHEVSYQTEIGQLNDLRLQIADKKQETSGLNLELFNMKNYQLIVKYKTAFYSFYLPLACGLVVAGIEDEKIFKETETICLKMGEYFQIQDDFLDCYADPAVLGKVGRDIEEAKCGWLVVQALLRCTPEQRQIIQENYGVNDAEKVQKIKALYKELNMEKIFADYEEAAVKEMNDLIESSILKSRNQHNVYVSALSLIVKRKK